jgi:hypothetical protein
MKLAAGNPNLKDKLLRVNPTNKNSAPIKLKDESAARYVSGGAVLIEHHPDAAPPPRNSVWDRPPYEPRPAFIARAGANNHLTHKSRGV